MPLSCSPFASAPVAPLLHSRSAASPVVGTSRYAWGLWSSYVGHVLYILSGSVEWIYRRGYISKMHVHRPHCPSSCSASACISQHPHCSCELVRIFKPIVQGPQRRPRKAHVPRGGGDFPSIGACYPRTNRRAPFCASWTRRCLFRLGASAPAQVMHHCQSCSSAPIVYALSACARLRSTATSSSIYIRSTSHQNGGFTHHDAERRTWGEVVIALPCSESQPGASDKISRLRVLGEGIDRY